MRRRSAVFSTLGLLCALALPAQAQEIRFWTLNFANDAANKAFQDIIHGFEAKNPGVTIKLETRGVDEQKAALRVAANSNQAPDIYFSWAGPGLGGEFVTSGLALNMAKYYAEYKWDDELLPAADSFSRIYPGGRYGVPYTFHGEALYYNKALFAKAGITAPPTSYAALMADAAKLKAAHIPAITFGGTVNWHLMRLMDVILETKCGAAKHDALMARKLDWTTEPCATASFEALHDWTANYLLKPFMGIGEDQSFNLFLAGRAAMMLEGDWLVGELTQNGKPQSDYGLFPFPTGTDRLYGFAEYNYISTKSQHPDLAAKFLDYLISTPVQQAHLGAFGAISVNKDVVPSEKGTLDHAWIDIFHRYSGVFMNGDQAFPTDITTEYWRVINDVATDHLAPAKAAAVLQGFIASHH